MTPKPNKTGLVYLLRAHGYDVPSIGAASFEGLLKAKTEQLAKMCSTILQ